LSPLKAGYGARRRPIGDEVSPLWEWLPATIPSRQDAAPTEKGQLRLKLGFTGSIGLLA
jgi:hypothetical protein